ncbi:hypothetical protein [Sinimarinibacterium sp. NLF-5-8]|uniref:hypothetical protein n=1 Tax=Sinimarinibacterium sp. NLF-5-8 TaxID=2698684 RepID=UPI00137C3051|nr:hypothetical protein [Sinimarinibacterium sp. NLF-5-8]QHS09090.1 hypothetical protein GT972_02280 [Sinimarinibacterium sp. NLF-5-8]
MLIATPPPTATPVPREGYARNPLTELPDKVVPKGQSAAVSAPVTPPVITVPVAVPDEDQLGPALSAMIERNGLELVESFKTPAEGLTGHLTLKNGQYDVLFTTDNGYLISGAVLSPDGRNLVSDYIAARAPVKDVTQIMQALDASKHIIEVGAEGLLLTAMIDPDCAACSEFGRRALTLAEAGVLRVRFVMLGALGARSMQQAAAILQAPNPAQALAQHFEGNEADAGTPAAMTDPAITAETQAALDVHQGVMTALSSSAAPTLVYRDTEGRDQVVSGWPGSLWLDRIVAAHITTEIRN